jgi:hypothetical protein
MAMNDAAQILIAAIPLVAVVVLGFLGFFYFLWDFRTIRFIVDKGGTPLPRRLDEKLLLIGIVSFFVGIALLVFFLLKGEIGDSLLGGLIPTMAGAGIIVHFIVVRRLHKE